MQQQPLCIYVRGGCAVITTPTWVGRPNAPQLRALLDTALYEHPPLIVDMTATSRCDPAGLGELLTAALAAAAGGGEVRLAVGCPSQLSTAVLIRLQSFCRIFRTVSEALAAPGLPVWAGS